MLKSCRVSDQNTSQRLLTLWAKRYKPELVTLATSSNEFPVADLVVLTSAEGRAQTSDRVMQRLINYCELAGLKTNNLYAYIPNVINLSEALSLACSVEQVYRQILTLYRRQPPLRPFLKYFSDTEAILVELGQDALMLPLIHQLASDLEPILLTLQKAHLETSNYRTVGFLTTQFHLVNQSIQASLSPCEQLLLGPFLKFAEEQVAIPWPRVCAVADGYSADTPEIGLVEKLMAACYDIADEVYTKLKRLFPHIQSRRGTLHHAGVQQSTLRDLMMLQAYLWLALLEKDTAILEQELLPMCQMVFPAIDIPDLVVKRGIELLVVVVERHTPPPQLPLIYPCTRKLLACFQDWGNVDWRNPMYVQQ